MLEVIFTLDYEIYGNGRGLLQDLIYTPAEKLEEIFKGHNAPFVAFIEVAELEVIEAHGADPGIALVKKQLREFRTKGIELGLHLHPQWYNARFSSGGWELDFREYNLSKLLPHRIDQIIGRSIDYLRVVLGEPGFTPFSFRAGNWLLQPTREVANSLAKHGIKVDSSVFKGGLQHAHNLDYRRSCKNGYYWPFSDDVNVPDPQGALLEIPTFTRMVPAWKMLSSKRIGLQQKNPTKSPFMQSRLTRLKDFVRILHPMKLDFCRLTALEMIRMLDLEIKKDLKDSAIYRPLVAIGHTKDLRDFETVEAFLSYLRGRGIPISTFQEVYQRGRWRDRPSH